VINDRTYIKQLVIYINKENPGDKFCKKAMGNFVKPTAQMNCTVCI